MTVIKIYYLAVYCFMCECFADESRNAQEGGGGTIKVNIVYMILLFMSLSTELFWNELYV